MNNRKIWAIISLSLVSASFIGNSLATTASQCETYTAMSPTAFKLAAAANPTTINSTLADCAKQNLCSSASNPGQCSSRVYAYNAIAKYHAEVAHLTALNPGQKLPPMPHSSSQAPKGTGNSLSYNPNQRPNQMGASHQDQQNNSLGFNPNHRTNEQINQSIGKTISNSDTNPSVTSNDNQSDKYKNINF